MVKENRLDTIIHCVPHSHTVADIGTDHGYIPVDLIERGIAKHVIASDISSHSLEKAKTLIKNRGLEDAISTRVGYGLSVLNPGEVDTVIIAGLGGVLISDILKEDRDIAKTVDTFILQPMQWTRPLREYLIQNDYTIEDEILVCEGINRYYVIMVVGHGREEIRDEMDYYLGRRLVEKKDPLLPEYILHNIRLRQNILKNLSKSKYNKEVKNKRLKLEEEIKRLKEVYSNVCTD